MSSDFIGYKVQYLDDPSNFLKLLYDDHASTLKVVATGSSAFYIDGAFKDSLAGRKKLFHLFGCNPLMRISSVR